MKTLFSKNLRYLALVGLGCLTALTSPAQEAAAEPTVEQRLADLEAYVNNTARTPDVISKIPGP